MFGFYFYLSLIVFIGNFKRGWGVNININLDFIQNNTNLKVYNGPINVPNCPNFENTGSFLFLKLSTILKSFTCTATNGLIFNVFTYSSSIQSSLITVPNKYIQLEDFQTILTGIRNKTIILSFTKTYITFVICLTNTTDCPFRNLEKKTEINSAGLNLYSACYGLTDGGSCITDVIFTLNLTDVDANPNIMGTEIIIAKSNMTKQFQSIKNCFNGGTLAIDSTTQETICNCPDNNDFIERGRQCEALQMSLIGVKYLYVLPNTINLVMEFSLYSNAHQKLTEIFQINSNSNSFLMDYKISEFNHIFKLLTESISIYYPIDMDNNWLNVVLNISTSESFIQVNEQKRIFNLKISQLILDTVPLIINRLPNVNNEIICLSNLKINSQLVDLYTPDYSNCKPDCRFCSQNSKCIFLPFKAASSNFCICKIGFTKNANNVCQQDPNSVAQINNNQEITVKNPTTDFAFTGIQFKFRTLATGGNILTFILLKPSGFNLSMGIMNGFIYANLKNSTKTQMVVQNLFPVSNGEWHTASLKITYYFLELNVDEYFPIKSIFEQGFFDNSLKSLQTSQVIVGKLVNTDFQNKTLSTCFNTLSLVSVDIRQNPFSFNLSGSLQNICDSGPNCNSVNCTGFRTCAPRWQNTSCVCIGNFTDINGNCIFYKCVPNPCMNSGVCVYDAALFDYKCQCTDFYTGRHCENAVSVASFPWWIILLILLIILIIIIVLLIYFCCCKKKKKQDFADIDKVHENTVCYNDQAGESDYYGPPINFNIMKNYVSKPEAPPYSSEDLIKRKNNLLENDNDVIIDHPLEYEYEGLNSELDSISSLGSGSTDEELNIQPLNKADRKFDYLRNVYE